MGAFEQLFGPVKREFEKKNSNARGIARGGCSSFDLTHSTSAVLKKKENNLKDREVERKKKE